MKDWKKFFKIAFFVNSAIFGFLLGVTIAVILYYYKFIPSFEELEKIKPALVTKVYDRDGNVIKEYYIQKRIVVPLDSIPDFLINGLIATEDKNFYKHHGIDLINGILRSVIVDILHGKTHGGSTITQQLARNLFTSTIGFEKRIPRKIKEIITAIMLEKTYTKKEILQFYLNQVYLGGGAYGVQAASQRYFSKNVWELTPDEAAIFIAMLRAPEKYRPDKHPENAKKRRNIILKKMYETDIISKTEYEELKNKPIEIHPFKTTQNIAPYFVEEVRKFVVRKFGEKMLYTGGLRIYTTLVSQEQDSLEKIFHKYIMKYQREMNIAFFNKYLKYRWDKIAPKEYKNIPKDSLFQNMDTILARWANKLKWIPREDTLVSVQGAFLAIDNNSGAVRVMIGGRNFEESEYNRVFARRQPGSSFKPIIYLTAISQGFTPSSILLDQPIVIPSQNKDEDDWRPHNYEEKFLGPVLLMDALAHSLNLATIYLLNKVGYKNVIEYANKLGLKSNYIEVPALALGVFEVRLWDLVKAYSVFPNYGILIKPYYIERIEDNSGNVIYQHTEESKRVLPEDVSYIMITLLENVVRRGTGYRIIQSKFYYPCGGKTGTTNNYTDTWFIGFTPIITAGAWVGTDIKRKLGDHKTGASTALPIWIEYMKLAHKDKEVVNFKTPRGITYRNICTQSGKLARLKVCPKIYYHVPFIIGTQPVDTCDIHLPENLKKSSNPWLIEKERINSQSEDNPINF